AATAPHRIAIAHLYRVVHVTNHDPRSNTGGDRVAPLAKLAGELGMRPCPMVNLSRASDRPNSLLIGSMASLRTIYTTANDQSRLATLSFAIQQRHRGRQDRKIGVSIGRFSYCGHARGKIRG